MEWHKDHPSDQMWTDLSWTIKYAYLVIEATVNYGLWIKGWTGSHMRTTPSDDKRYESDACVLTSSNAG